MSLFIPSEDCNLERTFGFRCILLAVIVNVIYRELKFLPKIGSEPASLQLWGVEANFFKSPVS